MTTQRDIYEQDLKYFSYGFRPGRSAHEALAWIWSQCTHQGIRWILEVDIRKYFDTLKKEWLRKFLGRRVRDGVGRRLIDKWLKAGVWEKGQLSYPEDGTPQGGVISPFAEQYLSARGAGLLVYRRGQTADEGQNLSGAICR